MIKSLLLKDLYILNKDKYIVKNLAVCIIIACFFCFAVSKESASMMPAIINVGMMFRLYENEEKNRTLARIKSMPVKIKAFVLEKYILTLGLIAGSYALTSIMFLIAGLAGKNIVAEDYIVTALSYFVIFSVYCLYTPISYKFSTRAVTIVVFLLTFFIIMIVALLFSNVSIGPVQLSDIEIAAIIIAICIAVILISYFCSIKVIKNKDF